MGDAPSRYAIDDRKTAMFTGAKTNWSQATRAAMVRFVLERLMRVARKVYHFVAAGPKTAVLGGVRVGGVLGGRHRGRYLRRRLPFVLCV